MGFDLYIAPASGFLEWSDEQWEKYFETYRLGEDFRLGRSVYVGLVLEAITHNLENDKEGSMFPLLMRISRDEVVGWYHDVIAPLLAELEQIKSGLARLPINRQTLNYDNDEDVQQRITDFKEYYPDRPLQTLYDLYFHFIDGFIDLARKAMETGRGLHVTY